MPGGHEHQESQRIGPGVDGIGEAEGGGLEQPKPVEVARIVLIQGARGFQIFPGNAVVDAKAQREDAAGGGNLDPDRIDIPVSRRESRPKAPEGQPGERRRDCEGQSALVSGKPAIEADQSAEQDGGKQIERHGGTPAEEDGDSIQLKEKH
ncbi:hypothetical protein QM467_06440 [Rhodoblastus sp. 17X3]|uniref:hypothetical protein n=1 Tax=Rhodoblastus sp. 17X3 TaxID=3047026 RepID=UPI0024B6A56B|nr:hypothetical protein [Rhodoblastus sp. 17X3]MDI9847694.1 hypothetical protein [Rhodoblastus sp. 17X3]